MRRTRILLTLAFGTALLVSGCSKKPPETVDEDYGTTEGVEPDESELETEVIEPDEPAVPVTPAIGGEQVTGQDMGEESQLEDVQFDFDRYDIRHEHQSAALEKNARWLLGNPGWKVLIEGHCDERGTEEYNLALGDRRASAAKAYLRDLGVTEDRMSTISYGEAYPVDPSANEGAWRRNRRAHFVAVSPAGR